MDLEKNKQRLEILATEIEELKRNGGGGGTSDSYTKEEADDKFAEKATTYTKTEVDEAIASAAGGDVVVDGDNVKTKNAGLGKGILIGNQAGFNSLATWSDQIAIGTRAGIINPSSGSYPIAIGYQASGKGSDIVIGNLSANTGNDTENVLIGQRVDARGGNGVGIGHSPHVGDHDVSIGWGAGGAYTQNGVYVGFACQTKLPSENSNGQIAIGSSNKASGNYAMGFGTGLNINTKQVVLGRYSVESNNEDCFIVGNGTDSNNKSNLIEITTPFTVSTDGIEVNGVPFAPSVSDSSYASTTAIPTDATNVACDVPYSHITKHNDFTLLKAVNSYTYAVRFQYSQSTTSNTCFYKGSFVNPSSNTLETYVVEIGPDSNIENTLVRLIGKYEVNKAT